MARLVVLVCAVFFDLLMVGAGAVHGQDYPNKPIRFFTGTPGSSVDLTSRVIGQALSTSLGQPVVVENRNGGGPVVGPTVAKTPPDGYNLFLYGNTLWLTPLLQNDVVFDPIRDFAGVILAASSPGVLVVHPSLPVRSVKELIAFASAKPGQLNYGSTGAGSVSHLSMELFKSMAAVDIVRVNYNGMQPATIDLTSGALHVMFNTTTGAVPHIASGRLRALAVSSERPSPLTPGLPTVAASGLPGFETVSTLGLIAPAKTPVTVINRLNRELAAILAKPDVKERLLKADLEAVGGSPAEFQATMKNEIEKYGKVIKAAGIRAE